MGKVLFRIHLVLASLSLASGVLASPVNNFDEEISAHTLASSSAGVVNVAISYPMIFAFVFLAIALGLAVWRRGK